MAKKLNEVKKMLELAKVHSADTVKYIPSSLMVENIMTNQLVIGIDSNQSSGNKVSFDTISTEAIIDFGNIDQSKQDEVKKGFEELLKSSLMSAINVNIKISEGSFLITTNTVNNPKVECIASVKIDSTADNAEVEFKQGKANINSELVNIIKGLHSLYEDNGSITTMLNIISGNSNQEGPDNTDINPLANDKAL